MIRAKMTFFTENAAVKILLIYGVAGVLISCLLRWWGLIIPPFAAPALLILGGLGATPLFDTLLLLLGKENDEYDPEPFEEGGICQGVSVFFLSAISTLPGFTWGLVFTCAIPGILLALLPKWESKVYENFPMLLIFALLFILANARTLGYF